MINKHSYDHLGQPKGSTSKDRISPHLGKHEFCFKKGGVSEERGNQEKVKESDDLKLKPRPQKKKRKNEEKNRQMAKGHRNFSESMINVKEKDHLEKEIGGKQDIGFPERFSTTSSHVFETKNA